MWSLHFTWLCSMDDTVDGLINLSKLLNCTRMKRVNVWDFSLVTQATKLVERTWNAVKGLPPNIM